ncbi:hypothetical protein [Agaribacterium sp. ZY112]|uniref:hypothetical protein n=1 Tax=Agaribacterium sp. ZY112 TaxID=3233574 RepID=UPI003525FC58
MAIDWNFHRGDLVKKMHDGYTALGSNHQTIFADRQKGKTHFATQDLIPVMQDEGYFCVYVDFWSKKESPGQAFTSGVIQSYNKTRLLKNALGFSELRFITPDAPPLNTSLGIIDNTVLTPNTAINWLLNVSDRQPIFIVLDEVQHLTTNREFDEFTASLRSFLVNQSLLRKHLIQTLFIGSDQVRLASLFENRKAPFYKASYISAFEGLDKEFSDFAVDCFEQSRDINTLDKTEAYKLFKDGGRLPGRFIDLLQKMASVKRYDLIKSAQEFKYFPDETITYR